MGSLTDSNGLVYGCVCIEAREGSNKSSVMFPFSELEKVERGSHLRQLDSPSKIEDGPDLMKELLQPWQAFDYVLGASSAETAKVYATTRGLAVSAYRVGEDYETNLCKNIIRHLLALNSGVNDDEASSSFLDLAYSKIFLRTTGSMFVMLNINSTQSKFVLMTRDVPVYLFCFCDDHHTYLIWSNEESLEQRMKKTYGSERFFYYRMPSLVNGLCAVHSFYLKKKMTKWSEKLKDKLKVMNALENYLLRRSIAEA